MSNSPPVIPPGEPDGHFEICTVSMATGRVTAIGGDPNWRAKLLAAEAERQRRELALPDQALVPPQPELNDVPPGEP